MSEIKDIWGFGNDCGWVELTDVPYEFWPDDMLQFIYTDVMSRDEIATHYPELLSKIRPI